MVSWYAGGSGYAALRRTLAGAGEDDTKGQKGDRGFSDLVRKPQNFKLWQVVRASTAAPTFFPSERRVSRLCPAHVPSRGALSRRSVGLMQQCLWHAAAAVEMLGHGEVEAKSPRPMMQMTDGAHCAGLALLASRIVNL